MPLGFVLTGSAMGAAAAAVPIFALVGASVPPSLLSLFPRLSQPALWRLGLSMVCRTVFPLGVVAIAVAKRSPLVDAGVFWWTLGLYPLFLAVDTALAVKGATAAPLSLPAPHERGR